LAEHYGVAVILHTDHAAKKLLPWIDGLLDHGEKFFAETGKPLFSSHMLDLSEEPIEENIEISAKYLERMAKMGMTLEIELGVTGGEEDGVDNSDVDSSRLYTQPEEVSYSYEHLLKVSPRFTVAAAFGNVHGVYKPGNVKLQPVILHNSQEYVKQKFNLTAEKPINFVFHGGSGSSQEEIREAISYGAIKMNIDTDMQWAYWEGIKDYYKSKEGYLQSKLVARMARILQTKNITIHVFGYVKAKKHLLKDLLQLSKILTVSTRPANYNIHQKLTKASVHLLYRRFVVLTRRSSPKLKSTKWPKFAKEKRIYLKAFANWATIATGSSAAFITAIGVIIVWGITGPFI
jgi:ketose-bisphosphate aldolase